MNVHGFNIPLADLKKGKGDRFVILCGLGYGMLPEPDHHARFWYVLSV